LKPTDLEALFLRIVTETAKFNPAFMNWSSDSIRTAVETSQFRFFQTEHDQIASMICFQQNPDFTEILALGTVSEFQRQGYSEKLLKQFTDECGATSKFITLEVHCKNQQAINLYQKCGFKIVRIRKKYYSDGADALVMDKSCLGI
jgi:ribosomal protein S18 acetylase RimI-like enzyme